MMAGYSHLNYVFAAVTVVAGIMLAMIAHTAVTWLKRKAETTGRKFFDIIIAAFGTPVQITMDTYSGDVIEIRTRV